MKNQKNSGVPPALILAAVNAYILYNDHHEHLKHSPPLEERTEYPYQNIRTRNFSFGNGDETLLYVILPMSLHLSCLVVVVFLFALAGERKQATHP